MRKIQFRGKKKDSGEWVFGNFYTTGGGSYIVKSSCEFYKTKVIPKTVGQYTGLTDKNGVKVFEGDIVHILGNQDVDDWKNLDYNALIVFFNGGFCAIDGTEKNHSMRRYNLSRCEFDLVVIGNIHDNPDLLKGGEKDFLKAKECKKE